MQYRLKSQFSVLNSKVCNHWWAIVMNRKVYFHKWFRCTIAKELNFIRQANGISLSFWFSASISFYANDCAVFKIPLYLRSYSLKRYSAFLIRTTFGIVIMETKSRPGYLNSFNVLYLILAKIDFYDWYPCGLTIPSMTGS